MWRNTNNIVVSLIDLQINIDWVNVLSFSSSRHIGHSGAVHWYFTTFPGQNQSKPVIKLENTQFQWPPKSSSCHIWQRVFAGDFKRKSICNRRYREQVRPGLLLIARQFVQWYFGGFLGYRCSFFLRGEGTINVQLTFFESHYFWDL